MSNPVKKVEWSWDFDHRPTVKEIFDLLGPEDVPDEAEVSINESNVRGAKARFQLRAVVEQPIHKTTEDLRKENPL